MFVIVSPSCLHLLDQFLILLVCIFLEQVVLNAFELLSLFAMVFDYFIVHEFFLFFAAIWVEQPIWVEA